MKSLKHDGHICTFRNVMIALLLNHNKALKCLSGDSNIITVVFLQSVYFLSIGSDYLKEWGEKVK